MAYSYYAYVGDRITLSIQSSDKGVAAANPDLALIEGDADIETQYMVEGVVTDRPQQRTTLTGATLESLPTPCTILVNGLGYDCTDATADLTFDQPGTYTVRVEAWPYLDKEFIVENPAP